MEAYEKIGKVNAVALLRVSASGKGLYLYLPKDLADVFGLVSGDKVKVEFQEIYRLRGAGKEGEKDEG